MRGFRDFLKPLFRKNTDRLLFSETQRQGVNITDDFSLASEYLAIRIYPDDYAGKVELDEFVYRKDLEGTVSLLVLDLPYSVESLLKSFPEKWGKDAQTLFGIAEKNMMEKYRPELSRNEKDLIIFSGDPFFITSNALYLHRFPQCHGSSGTLVALPNRELLLCKPISSDIDLEIGLEILIPYADKMFSEGPGSITPHIYWFYKGKYERIFSTIGLSRFNYVLPVELEEMLF